MKVRRPEPLALVGGMVFALASLAVGTPVSDDESCDEQDLPPALEQDPDEASRVERVLTPSWPRVFVLRRRALERIRRRGAALADEVEARFAARGVRAAA